MFQPDQPGNLGAALRLGACLDVAVHVVEPCGFPLDDRRVRRAALDYGGPGDFWRHATLPVFLDAVRGAGRRLVLLTTKAERSCRGFAFRADDVLLLGQESRGVPPAVRGACDVALAIPMRPGPRSLNVVTAAALVLGHVCHALDLYPLEGRHALSDSQRGERLP